MLRDRSVPGQKKVPQVICGHGLFKTILKATSIASTMLGQVKPCASGLLSSRCLNCLAFGHCLESTHPNIRSELTFSFLGLGTRPLSKPCFAALLQPGHAVQWLCHVHAKYELRPFRTMIRTGEQGKSSQRLAGRHSARGCPPASNWWMAWKIPGFGAACGQHMYLRAVNERLQDSGVTRTVE